MSHWQSAYIWEREKAAVESRMSLSKKMDDNKGWDFSVLILINELPEEIKHFNAD